MTQKYEFPVSFTCRHEECDNQFKTMAIEQVLKLSKFHNRIEDSIIIFDKKKTPLIRLEISIRVPGSLIAAVHEDFNPARALDEVIKKAKVQLQKVRSKDTEHRAVQPEIIPKETESEKE